MRVLGLLIVLKPGCGKCSKKLLGRQMSRHSFALSLAIFLMENVHPTNLCTG